MVACFNIFSWIFLGVSGGSVLIKEDEVVVRIIGGPRIAKSLADELGYVYNGPVSINILIENSI